MEWISKVLTTWIVGSLALGVAWVLLIELFRFNLMKKLFKNFWGGLLLSASFMVGRVVKSKELVWFFILCLAATFPVAVTMEVRNNKRTIEKQSVEIYQLRRDLSTAKRDIINLYTMQDSTFATGERSSAQK